MNNLATRVISALIAAGLLVALMVYFGVPGLRLGSAAMIFKGIWELRKLLFRRTNLLFLAAWILPITWALEVFFPSWPSQELLLIELVLLGLLFMSVRLIRLRQQDTLAEVLDYDGKSILGLFYIGLLPWFAVRLLVEPLGLYWFFGMLLTVFAGDTFAYFSGKLWGEQKIMPTISPKKTVAGSWGGVFGSTLAGLVCAWFIPSVPLWAWLVMAPLAGAVAQIGDFSESLFKRVAEVKDSGRIMPGHGGVLDRLDGVLFAAPLFYLLARIFNT